MVSSLRELVNGSLTRDFRTLVFFMNQCPPGTQVFQWGRFEFFRTFAEIFANECLSQVSTTPAISCSAVSMTPARNLFSVIASDVDTGDKFITGPVTGPRIRMCEVPLRFFMAVPMTIAAAVADFGGRR